MALNNSQYNAILRVYGDRQLKSNRELQARKEKAYREIPTLRELDRTVPEQSLLAAEALRNGDRSRKEMLQTTIREVGEKRRALLRAHHLPEDYLEPRYVCGDCQDTGFVQGEKCHCFRRMQRELLYQQSNVSEVVGRENFDSFRLEIFDNRTRLPQAQGKTNREYMATVVEYLKGWCRAFSGDSRNLVLMGASGTGKTFLMNCVTRALLDRGFSVIYLTSTDLFESLGRAMREREDREQDLQTAILECDLLAIDDLGTELTNSFTTTQLFHVLNHRMVQKKPVMISTNLSFESMKDQYSDRIVSRINTNRDYIPLYGKDQRL